MPVAFESVLADLKGKKYAPIYFLQGEEPYFIDVLSDWIEQNVLSEGEKGFNQMVMYGKDSNLMTVLSNAKRFPMMSEKQVVIVKEAQEMADWEKDIEKHPPLKQFDAYLTNPLPSTILVFAYKYKKLDARKALSKKIDKHAVCIDSKKIYDNQLPEFINQYFSNKGFKISPKASAILAENVGVNLSRLANESDKIIINVSVGEQISEEHVHKYVGISKEYNVFELQKALGNKNALTAYKIVDYFASNPKANPLVLLIPQLFSYFVKILLIHISKDKDEKSLAASLGVHPFFVKDYLAAARFYSLPKLEEIIHLLKIADINSKGVDAVSVDEGQLMKELVYKILR